MIANPADKQTMDGHQIIYFRIWSKDEKDISLPLFALIIGGALSNILDRIIYGSVIDFINFSFWPAFNIADSAITIGVILLIIKFIHKDEK